VVGETAHFNVTSNFEGYPVYWYGAKDGQPDAADLYFGKTNMLNFDYGPFTDNLIPSSAAATVYARYFVLKDEVGNSVCRSGAITISLRRP